MSKFPFTVSFLLSTFFISSQPAFAMKSMRALLGKESRSEKTNSTTPSRGPLKIIAPKEQTLERKLDTINSVGATVRSVQSSLDILFEIAKNGAIKLSATPVFTSGHGIEDKEITISGISQSLSGTNIQDNAPAESINPEVEKASKMAESLKTLGLTIETLTDRITQIIEDDGLWNNLSSPYNPKDKTTSCQDLLNDSIELLKNSEKTIRAMFLREYSDNAEGFLKIANALLTRSNPIHSQATPLRATLTSLDLNEKSQTDDNRDPYLEVMKQLQETHARAERLNKRLTVLLSHNEAVSSLPLIRTESKENLKSSSRQRSQTDVNKKEKRGAINPDDPQLLERTSSFRKQPVAQNERWTDNLTPPSPKKSSADQDNTQQPSAPKVKTSPLALKRSGTVSSPVFHPKIIEELKSRIDNKDMPSAPTQQSPLITQVSQEKH